ncbi:MAG: DUF6308 family protein [Streptosporangiales bacterium]
MHPGRRQAPGSPACLIRPEVRDGPQPQAGKLLARKRPRLVPVTGEIIVARGGPAGQTWPAPRHCLQDESLRRAIEALRSRHAGTASVLRLLAVAPWMLHSESTAAGNARAAASVTPRR